MVWYGVVVWWSLLAIIEPPQSRLFNFGLYWVVAISVVRRRKKYRCEKPVIQYRQFLRKNNSSKSHLPQEVKTTFVDFSVVRNHVEENMLILRELNTSTKLPKHRGEPAMTHPEITNNIESQNMQSVGNVLQIVKDLKEMYGEAQGFPYRFSGGEDLDGEIHA